MIKRRKGTFRAQATLALLFIAFCLNISAYAQSTAQINGIVRDQSGAVLPGVEVTVTQTDTGLLRMVVTDETGSYVLPNLPIGPYRLEASLPGFKTYVQTGIVLQVGSNPQITAILEVGQVSDQIEVQPDSLNNALIISASKENLDHIKELLGKIDVEPIGSII